MFGPQNTSILKKKIKSDGEKRRVTKIARWVQRLGYWLVDRRICVWFLKTGKKYLCSPQGPEKLWVIYYVYIYIYIKGKAIPVTSRGSP
jgi:hypothetical protein